MCGQCKHFWFQGVRRWCKLYEEYVDDFPVQDCPDFSQRNVLVMRKDNDCDTSNPD